MFFLFSQYIPEYIEKIRKTLPLLPKELYIKFTNKFGLSDYDSIILIEEKEIALYFLEITKHTKNYKTAANIVNGAIKAHLNEFVKHISEFSISAIRIAELIQLIDDGKVSNSVATSKVFTQMLESDLSAEEIAKNNNWIQDSDTDSLSEFVKQVIAKYPEKVEEYKSGKKGLIGLFMGEVMKLSRGKADPKLANQLVRAELEK